MRRAPPPAAVARRRGLALVVVLWLLVVLGMIATIFATTTRTETRVVANEIENGRARELADAGIHRVIPALFDLDAQHPWPIEGTPRDFALPGGTVSVAVQDERGRISLNLTHEAFLRDMMRAVVGSERRGDEIADLVVDWRDEDDNRHVGGAEARDYRAAGLDYTPRNAPLRTVGELRLLKGMDAATFAQMAPFVTVYSPQPMVDLSVAPEFLLRIIPGIPPEAIAAILTARRDWLEGRGPPPPGMMLGGGLGGAPAPAPIQGAPAQSGLTPMTNLPKVPTGAPLPEGAVPSPLAFVPSAQSGPQSGAAPPQSGAPAAGAGSSPNPGGEGNLLPQAVPQAPGSVYAIRATARTDEGAVFVREAVVWVRVGAEPAWWVLDWREGSASGTTMPTAGAVTRRP